MISILRKLRSKKSSVIKNNIILNSSVREDVYKIGYSIVKIEPNYLKNLKSVFEQNHSINDDQGSMFYSVYSQNIPYRKKINKEIEDILKPVYNRLFTDYKTVLNSFIIKTPGEGSEFQPHQDSTGLDESIYSPLSVWIPLDGVDESNGCIFLIPKSHHLAPIYRGITLRPNFENIKNEIKQFFKPIKLEKGEMLLFDNRMIHTSSMNRSNKQRVVVMSGIFPQSAQLISCYQEPGSDFMDVYSQKDDFLIENKSFYFNCTERPYLGEKIKTVKHKIKDLKVSDFKNLNIDSTYESDILKYSQTNFNAEPA